MLSGTQQQLFENVPSPRIRLRPLVKWPGGKEQELKYITPNLPSNIERYFEPFVGGGAVYTSIDAEQLFVNDKSDELIGLYRCIGGEDRGDFFNSLEEINRDWDVLTSLVDQNSELFVTHYQKYSSGLLSDEEVEECLFKFIDSNSQQFNRMFAESFDFDAPNFLKEIRVNLVRKVKRMRNLERTKNVLPEKDILDNIEAALKSAFYMQVRHIYNNVDQYGLKPAFRSAVFLFIRNFAYSGMFRYSPFGGFNVPYGGIGYNRKDFRKKLEYLMSEDLHALLNRTGIENLDFEEFLRLHEPRPGDFIFLDPPYDSEFSTYTKNEFAAIDQARLANFMKEECQANWMLVIKNTALIRQLYFEKGLRVRTFDKTYHVSFMNRNDKSAEHLMITNY